MSTPRQITDAKVLAAMAHPLRRRLLDLLRVHGPATATTLADRTGQAIGNISHHLRALAACELIVEAPELARDRRERWWQIVAGGTRWNSIDFADDGAAEVIERTADSLNLERQIGFVRAFAGAGHDERASWPSGPFSTDHWLHLTDEELAEFATEVVAVFRRWADREQPADGAERRPVFAFARAVPAAP